MYEKLKNIGIYIHIPFCKSKCYYCDFNSYAGKQAIIPAYFEALKKEIAHYSPKLEGYEADSVFIGGGTPSYIEASYMVEILRLCRQNFNIPENAEISIETNPGTLTREKLFMYGEAGINRLSIGLQAWQDMLLEKLGRSHSRKEFVESMELAVNCGFCNINVDMIFAIPGQTLNDWLETVTNISGLNPSHISTYSLIIEEGTVFGRMKKEGVIKPVEDELDREMYWSGIEKLKNYGFEHYEISNFAKKGSRCRQNLKYWHAEEYLGLGAGAHSYLNGKRFENVYIPENYISDMMSEGSAAKNFNTIGIAEAMNEYMMLGLRLVEGVSAAEFKKRFGVNMFDIFAPQIERLNEKGLILAEDSGIRLSQKGLDLANQAFMEFV